VRLGSLDSDEEMDDAPAEGHSESEDSEASISSSEEGDIPAGLVTVSRGPSFRGRGDTAAAVEVAKKLPGARDNEGLLVRPRPTCEGGPRAVNRFTPWECPLTSLLRPYYPCEYSASKAPQIADRHCDSDSSTQSPVRM
jgi:hypothetical protein